MIALDSVAEVRDRCTFPPPGSPATCAVSGGADSLALLVLAADADLDVTAVHVDHGLRPDSGAEAEIVADAAGRFGAAFRAERVTVVPGGNVEARARHARHQLFGADALFGHTAEDQAETVLLALLRGAGLDGLRGIRPERHPILALRRAETEAICRDAGLTPVSDPSNADPGFRRNRIRHELIPLLADIAERDVVPILARTAAVVLDDADLLDTLAAAVDPTDVPALRAVAPAVARRAVRNWLRTANTNAHPPDAASVERVMAVVQGEAVATQVTGGVEVRRSRQRLTMTLATPRTDTAAGRATVPAGDGTYPGAAAGRPEPDENRDGRAWRD